MIDDYDTAGIADRMNSISLSYRLSYVIIESVGERWKVNSPVTDRGRLKV